jgi:proline dehydrogenase
MVSEAHDRNLGCTIPGRWLRSVDDARVACQWRLRVRVVKGQWADPRDPNVDMRSGFLKVIDGLCGRASSVAVATHDLPLAREAIGRLREAGTPSELELLYGVPCRGAVRLGRDLEVPVRFYVPQGQPRLPYLVNHARRNPRVLGWLARDVVRGYIRKSGSYVQSSN